MVGVKVLVGVRYGVSRVGVAVKGRVGVAVAVGSWVGIWMEVAMGTGVAVEEGPDLSARRTAPRQ